MINAYLQQTVVYWDKFISEFYKQFCDPTSQPRAADRLNEACQQKNHKVHQFITWVKNTAVCAGITDSKQLGSLIYKGVLPEIVQLLNHYSRDWVHT